MGSQSHFERDDGTRNLPGVDSPWQQWVAASATMNFCCDDTVLDWLEAHGESNGFKADHQLPGYDVRTDFRRFLRQKATEFEAVVTKHLAALHSLLRIASAPSDVRNQSAAAATWAAMAEGTEIIAQGVLWNPQTQTYGAPDLLVRSDVLCALFPQSVLPEQARMPAPALSSEPWHYRVVDIKFTTLNLLKDGQAGGDHLKYMVEVWLYNEALGRIQGFTPPSAFLLGRRWKASNRRGASALERLARVERERPLGKSGETLRDASVAACRWVRKVARDGGTWSVLPQPSVPELRPNAHHADDQPWHQAKLQILRELADLSLLPRVTPEKRTQALAGGLSCWSDTRCTAARLGIAGDTVAPLVDAVIRANHSPEDGPLVFPSRVTANEPLWREPAAAEFYVDFETVNDLDDDFSRFPEANAQPLIFMIGCGSLHDSIDGPQWNFRVFTARSLTVHEELRIIEAWLEYLSSACGARGTTLEQARLFHWSPAETSSLTEAYNAAHVRQGSPAWPALPWVDLLGRVIKEEPVTVRGAFGFGLKAIAKAMHAHGLIKTVWGDGPADGLGAMVGANWCHKEALRTGVSMTGVDLMQEIERYNEVDCKVMAEVLEYLRQQR